MENWIYLGLIASLCFGVNTVIYKLALSKQGVSPYQGLLFLGLGIFLVTVVVFVISKPQFMFNGVSIGLAIASGILWCIGMLAVTLALSKGADVSRLAPLYNTNTMIAVLLGLLLLKEIPTLSAMIRLVFGSLLIVIGAIIISV
jgi:uncharacterized membrane protein